jgi:pimeloyl-ACP methyl ester carboxylesterase
MSIAVRRPRVVAFVLHALLGGTVGATAVSTAGCGGGGTEPGDRTNPVAAREETLTLATPTGALAGTLVLPPGAGPFPAAILVSGSGPTDRDGNSRDGAGVALRNDALKLLAEGLAARGVATLRFDKRGVGASAGAVTSEADVRVGDFVEDVRRWRARLGQDARLGPVALAGHSEGALLALAAARTADVRAVVAIAGPGRRADEILLEQLAAQLPPDQVRAAARVLAELRAGRTVAPLPPELPPAVAAALFRPSVQPYLISLLALDPRDEASAVAARGIPVTVVQGTTDLQVSVVDAERLAGGAGRPARLFAGMNHVLRLAPADRAANLATYGNAALPLAPGVVDTVAAHVRTP